MGGEQEGFAEDLGGVVNRDAFEVFVEGGDEDRFPEAAVSGGSPGMNVARPRAMESLSRKENAGARRNESVE